MIPCLGDAGMGVSDADAGAYGFVGAADMDQCAAWCNAVTPTGGANLAPLRCGLEAVDGGTVIAVECGGCGS